MDQRINLQSTVEYLNELQKIATSARLNNDIKLPQLVTVGAQSTGKSTLLDAIVGVHFLPRGDGIVTRTPIVLQLSNISEESNLKEELRVNNTVCGSWKEVTDNIINETSKLAGPKDISDTPIYVTIRSPIVPNLSLVDLPGLVKVAMNGQQEKIVEQIKKMVQKYISNENTIILAVSDAGVDIANSDSLEMAREIDPKGERTLGILTKMDRLEGSKNLGFLSGELLERKLKLGYVGVKCRKIEESENVTMEDERNEEEIFFDDKKFDSVRPLLGVKNLIKVLEQIFSKHLRENIPKISDNLKNKIAKKQEEKLSYGEELLREEDKSRFIIDTVGLVGKSFINTLEGEQTLDDMKNPKIEGALKIKRIIDYNFMKSINEFNIFEDLKDDEIRVAIIKSESYMPSLFFKEKVFQKLMSHQIARLQSPSLQCLELIKLEMERIIETLRFPSSNVYINLQIELNTQLKEYLNRLAQDVTLKIKDYIQSQVEIIDTENPYFKQIFDYVCKKDEEELEKAKANGGGLFNSPNKQLSPTSEIPFAVKVFENGKKDNNSKMMILDSNSDKPVYCELKVDKHELDKRYKELKLEEPQSVLKLGPQMDSKEIDNLKKTKILMDCYIDIVKNDIKTNIPRFIRCFLVKKFIDNVNSFISGIIIKMPIDYLLETDARTIVAKKKCIQELENLNACYKLIQKVNERLKY